jgi:hypothetical protein
MKLETLKSILKIEDRTSFCEKILKFFEELDNLENIYYRKIETSEGTIPIITIAKRLEVNDVKHLKLFIGAQHNEYNGLFGIIEFFKMIQKDKIKISDIIKNNQILIFAPLMNPYGFLNPSKENKSGYYLKNGSNLNRFWRRTFAPEYKDLKDDMIQYPIPEHCNYFKDLLKDYWENEDLKIYLLDFHETSLLERFPREISKDLSIHYKFDHWLKEYVILNIMNLYNIKYFREPLFFKCGKNVDHNHINLSIKQLDLVFEKLLDYMVKNQSRLAFYFCYSEVSQEYCQRLAKIVYNNLKNKNVLWETFSPAYSHYFHDHGCFTKTSDTGSRRNLCAMELESQKQFFNIFEEIDKSNQDPNYLENKLKIINLSLELVLESIKQMIILF